MSAVDFGFFFARVIAFYSLGYRGGMELPVRAFWKLNNEIDRIEAERDRRLLRVMICAQSGGDSAKGLLESLNEKVGDVVKVTQSAILQRTEADRRGMDELRMMQHEGL